MSWTDFFPIFSDDRVADYLHKASAWEIGQTRQSFVGTCINPDDSGRHLLCLTLSPHLPALTQCFCVVAPSTEWKTSESTIPVEAFTVLRNAAFRLAAQRPEILLRVYLDPTWADSTQALIGIGCQVVQMAIPSPGPNPASLWRFLALEESAAVTFLSLETLNQADIWIERTAALRSTGLTMWRSPMDRRKNYRPIHPERFGSIRPLAVQGLLCSYAWHVQQTSGLADSVAASPLEEDPIYVKASKRQASWDEPDLAEFFLTSVIYPQAVFHGLLTLIEANDQHSRWQALDIEYCTWANPESELLFVNPIDPSSLWI